MDQIRETLESALADPLTFESYRASIRARKSHPAAADEELFEVEDLLIRLEERFEAMLARHPLAVNLHEVAWAFWRFRGDGRRASLHDRILRALAESIALSGDGATAESALIVDSTAEEYLYLSEKGLQRKEQHLVERGGRWFDVLRCSDDEGNERSLWFDIGAFYPESYGNEPAIS